MAVEPRAFASGSGSNSPGVTIPGTVQVGDAMVLISYSNVDCSFTTPSGWTIARAKDASEAGGTNSIVYERVAQSGDAGSLVSVVNDGAVGVKAQVLLAAYSGADPVDPVHVINSDPDPGGTASSVTPAVTTTVDGCYIIEATGHKNSTGTTFTARPAGSTSRLTLIGTGGGHMDSALVDRGPVAAGPYGLGTFTSDGTASSWVAYTIAIQPKSTTQTMRPQSDITTEGFAAVPTVGTGVAMASRIGEGVRDDATYVETPTNPTADVFEVRLAAGLDPLSSADHKISVVLSTAGGASSSSCTVALVQGTTVIASEAFTSIPETPTLYEFTLDAAEADAITDYGDLRIRFTWTVA